MAFTYCTTYSSKTAIKAITLNMVSYLQAAHYKAGVANRLIYKFVRNYCVFIGLKVVINPLKK